MNKLYKYLPFDVTVNLKYEDYDYDDEQTIVYNKNAKLLGIDYSTNRILVREQKSSDWWNLKYTKIKPILRPFEDLTKELPLTTVAAEMIGMEEGKTISITKTFWYLFHQWGNQIWLESNRFNIYENDLGIFIEHEGRNKIQICRDFTIREDFNSTDRHLSLELKMNPEKAFDFLRAMHFAVDFGEGEYIKL